MISLLEHQHKLAAALLKTEISGIRIDLPRTMDLGEELLQSIKETRGSMRTSAEAEIEAMELEELQERIDKLKREDAKARQKIKPFNFNSSKQVGELLFERLELPGQRKRATGNWITSKVYLEEIAHLHPIVENITKNNRYSTYYNTLIKGTLERAIDGVIYPTFDVNGTKQGRISHKNPNMGNVPARDPYWAKLRGIFLPPEGMVINCIDYSQIEVCVAAHFSQDKNLLRIINEGASQHDITAESLGIERSVAKTINFAMQYGATEYKIATILDCSVEEAKGVLVKYWETYSGQKRVIDECRRKVEAGRTVYNLFGRARHFRPGKRRPWDSDLRRGYSALIQGTAADITNRAFYLASDMLEREGLGRSGWTVHDELILFSNADRAEEAFDKVSALMIQVGKEIGLSVPLSVDGKHGLERWEK